MFRVGVHVELLKTFSFWLLPLLVMRERAELVEGCRCLFVVWFIVTYTMCCCLLSDSCFLKSHSQDICKYCSDSSTSPAITCISFALTAVGWFGSKSRAVFYLLGSFWMICASCLLGNSSYCVHPITFTLEFCVFVCLFVCACFYRAPSKACNLTNFWNVKFWSI